MNALITVPLKLDDIWQRDALLVFLRTLFSAQRSLICYDQGLAFFLYFAIMLHHLIMHFKSSVSTQTHGHASFRCDSTAARLFFFFQSSDNPDDYFLWPASGQRHCGSDPSDRLSNGTVRRSIPQRRRPRVHSSSTIDWDPSSELVQNTVSQTDPCDLVSLWMENSVDWASCRLTRLLLQVIITFGCESQPKSSVFLKGSFGETCLVYVLY